MKKADWARAGVAVSLGAFFGSFVSIKISGAITWWSVLVGFLVGGLLGYILMEYKRIGGAFVIIRKEIKYKWQKLDLPGKQGIIVGLATLFLSSIGLGCLLYFREMNPDTNVPTVIFSSSLLICCLSIVSGLVTLSIAEKAKSKRISILRYISQGFGRFPEKASGFVFIQMPFSGWRIIKFVGKDIIWRFLVLSHSMIGLMVGFDAALGTIAGSILRNPFIGAGVGLIALASSYLFGYRTVTRVA